MGVRSATWLFCLLAAQLWGFAVEGSRHAALQELPCYELPVPRSGKCPTFGKCGRTQPCTVEVDLNILMERKALFTVCVSKCGTVELEESQVPNWTEGLMNKFLTISSWERPVTETILDWSQCQAALNPEGKSVFKFMQTWAESPSVSKAVTGLFRPATGPKPSLVDRMTWAPYAASPLKGKEVLIVGAGPVGLRMAIEVQMLGGHARVLDNRDTYTRANVMKMWRFVKGDFESIGVGEFRAVDGTDDIRGNIALLQHSLTRIALSLGAELYVNAVFKGFEAKGGRWKATVLHKAQKKEFLQDFDAVMDASGTGSVVGRSEACGAQLFTKTLQKRGGLRKVAITMNWARFKGDTGSNWAFGQKEFTAVGQKMMHDLNTFKNQGLAPRIKVDDLVYFQSLLSNYVVVAARADVLAEQGIFLNPALGDINQLIAPSNLHKDNLEKAVRVITEDWRIPHSEEAGMLSGINKMAVFSFLDLYYTGREGRPEMARMLPRTDCKDGPPAHPQLAFVIGDALWAPFWPDGTGMSRGLLSVLHAGFTMVDFWRHESDPTSRAKVLERSAEWAKVGTSADGKDCANGGCTFDKMKAYVLNGYARGKIPRNFEMVMH